MKNELILEGKDLRSAGRVIRVPFRLRVESNGQISELLCTRVVRVLPGKRLVCFGEFNGRQIVAKIFLDPGKAVRHCSREKRGVISLKDAGIKTPELLVSGTVKPDNIPFLCFQRIIPALDLSEAWQKIRHEDRRVKLLCLALSAIAAQHEAGIKQDDLHLDNFLLSGDDIFTIDGNSVDARRIGKPLGKTKSLENLGLFFAQLYPKFDYLVPKAFSAYADKRAWPVTQALSARLIKKIKTRRNQRKKNILKKIYRECTEFACQKNWDQFLVCERSFHNEPISRFLADPDTVINSGKLLKDGNSSTVALVKIGARSLVVKRYNIKNIQHALKRCLRPSRAWVSWHNAHLLTILGIPTPKPIALLEKRWGPFRFKAYLVSEYVGGLDFYHLLHPDNAKKADRKILAERFGKLIQSLADASISHGDFKATNFIVTDDGISIIDLDAMCEHRFRWRFKHMFKKDGNRWIKNWGELPEIEALFRNQLTQIKL